MISEHFFDDRESMFVALSAECEQILHTALSNNQAATVLVSGGSTPLPLYQRLAQIELAWNQVDVALVDERWVAVDQPASNEAFIRNSLLQHNAAAAHFVAMKNAAETAVLGHGECEQAYQQLPRPFDLTLLGMGPDGHTASLFPLSKGLHRALDLNNSNLCSAITAIPSEVTGEFTERMSVTLAGLVQSRQLHLVITGEEKLAIYRQALAKPDAMLMPVSAVLQQVKVPVKVYWAP